MYKLLIVSLFFASCVKRPLDIKIPTTPIIGNGWASVENPKDTFTMFASGAHERNEAMNHVCDKQYVCSLAPIGEVFVVTRIKK